MTNLKITVITVCFNAAKTIERTIRSVGSQTYPNIEYVIIDGASTDDTLKIIDRYKSKIQKIISEKDQGIYDAMNKGIGQATGEVIYFLNADDYLFDDRVLEDIARIFMKHDKLNVVYGKVKLLNAPVQNVRFKEDFPEIKQRDDFLHHTICHQALCTRKSFFARVGIFNCRYKNAADYEWLIKSYKADPSGFLFTDRYIAYYNFLGQSVNQASITEKEIALIRLQHLFSVGRFWFFFRYVILRGVKKWILREAW